jgi:lysine-N-methylase
VDKAHFKALKNAASTEPSVKHFVENLKRYDEVNPKRYGTVVLQQYGACPALSAAKDCNIQKALGHHMLPEICQAYPRHITAIGSSTEVHGTLSCPEMARLCLMDPRAFEIGEHEMSIPIGKPVPHNRGFHAQVEKALHPLRRNFYAIRDLLIFCIDAQSLPFYDRLLLATATVGKLAEFKVDTAGTMLETDRKIEFLLLQTRLAILQGHVARTIGQESATSNAVMAQLSLLQRITDERLKMGGGGGAFLAKLHLAFVGLQFDANNMEHVASRYVAARDHFFSKIVLANPHLFENLVKNLIFSDCLPTGKGGDIENEWSDLLIAVGLIRAYLIGLSAHFQYQFSMVHCVGMIQSFYRVIQHNQKFYSNLREKLDELGLNSLATYMLLSK